MHIVKGAYHWVYDTWDDLLTEEDGVDYDQLERQARKRLKGGRKPSTSAFDEAILEVLADERRKKDRTRGLRSSGNRPADPARGGRRSSGMRLHPYQGQRVPPWKGLPRAPRKSDLEPPAEELMRKMVETVRRERRIQEKLKQSGPLPEHLESGVDLRPEVSTRERRNDLLSRPEPLQRQPSSLEKTIKRLDTYRNVLGGKVGASGKIGLDGWNPRLRGGAVDFERPADWSSEAWYRWWRSLNRQEFRKYDE